MVTQLEAHVGDAHVGVPANMLINQCIILIVVGEDANNSTKVAEISVSYQPDLSVNPVVKSADDAYKYLSAFFSNETIGLYERLVAGNVKPINPKITNTRLPP